MNYSKWMEALDGNLKLLGYNIPGTHDCATQYVQTSHFSKCQNTDITEQLEMGIRALDVRAMPKKKRLAVVHANARVYNSSNHAHGKMDLDDLLGKCYSFLDKNPSEAIILQFKNDSNDKNDEKSFDNLFYTYLSGNENRWFLENRMPTLDEARGKLVLLRRCYIDEKNPDFKNKSGLDLSRWLDQDTAEPHPLLLRTYSTDQTEIIIQDRYKYGAVDRWKLCVKPFLDERTAFDGKYILSYLSTAGGLRGPEYNAKIINAEFSSYKLDKGKYYGLMYFDFVTKELARKVIELNF